MLDQVQPTIGPYESRPAVCRDYDPRTADVTRLIAAMVYEHLPQMRVEHVGSTSVPGCAGKGIVDLMIPVADGELEKVKELLDRLGFQGQIGRDPFPETRPMRAGSFVHDGETFLVHVHVIPTSSPEVDDMRFFRTCLVPTRNCSRLTSPGNGRSSPAAWPIRWSIAGSRGSSSRRCWDRTASTYA